jgi:hypothetical protein
MKRIAFVLPILLIAVSCITGCQPVTAGGSHSAAPVDLTPVAELYQQVRPQVAEPALTAPMEQIIKFQSEGSDCRWNRREKVIYSQRSPHR